LQTSTATKTYAVRGATSETMFDYIARNGPTDDGGQRGSGLTTAKWSYVWKGNASKVGCGIASLTISVDLTVTLPKHESPQSLTPIVVKSWERFETDVNTHEQRHVEIYLAGANTMKQTMEVIEPKPSCDVLEKEIGAVWSGQQKAIEAAQESFHKEEDARLALARQPVQSQIEGNRGKIASLSSQIKGMDDQIESLRKDLKAAEEQISPVESQMQSLEGGYGRDMPPPIATRYQGLQQQYRTLVARYNSLVDQHNAAVERRSRTSAEYDQLITSTRDLVETYNWIR
jgi:predicted secreted Zn-dependent protease